MTNVFQIKKIKIKVKFMPTAIPTAIPVQWLLPVTMLAVLNINFVESSHLNSNSCIHNFGIQKDPRPNIARTAEVELLQRSIDSVEIEMERVNKRIDDVEDLLKSTSAVLMSQSERDQLVNKEWQLREEKGQLRTKETQLRKEKLSLLNHMDSPDQRDFSVTGDTSDGDGGLQLESEQQMSASLLTATQGGRLKACLYKGMKAVSFNLPGVVKDILNQEIDQVSVESARLAVRNGLPRTMLPEKVSETVTLTTAMVESKLSIESITGLALQTFFTSRQDPSLSCNFKRCLSDFVAVKGPVTGASKQDALVFSVNAGESVPFAIAESKDNTFSPVEQTGQHLQMGQILLVDRRRLALILLSLQFLS
jgi:hypothetical protein